MKKTLCIVFAILLMAAMFTGCASSSEEIWQEQYDLGVRYLNDGNYQEAVIAFSAAIQIDAKRAEAFLGRAYAYVSLGQYDAAWTDYQNAQTLAPEDPTVQQVIDDYRSFMWNQGLNEDGTAIQTGSSVETQSQPELSAVTVTDADCIVAGSYCYHIPKIYIDGQRENAFNQLVHQKVYAEIQKQEVLSQPSTDSLWLLGVLYTWGTNGRQASIVVKYMGDTDANYYDVFHIDLLTGEVLTDDALLAACGMDWEMFRSGAKHALQIYWDGQEPMWKDMVGEAYFNEMVARTLADSNLQDCIPYINAQGEWSFVAFVASPAGADAYWRQINMQTGELELIQNCTINHSMAQQNTKPVQETIVLPGTSITQTELVGTWVLDEEYTMNHCELFIRDMYGNMYGETSMLIGADGSFSYYVALEDGKGSYILNDNKLQVNFDSGTRAGQSMVLQVTEDGQLRIAMPYWEGIYTYWRKR